MASVEELIQLCYGEDDLYTDEGAGQVVSPPHQAQAPGKMSATADASVVGTT